MLPCNCNNGTWDPAVQHWRRAVSLDAGFRYGLTVACRTSLGSGRGATWLVAIS